MFLKNTSTSTLITLLVTRGVLFLRSTFWGVLLWHKFPTPQTWHVCCLFWLRPSLPLYHLCVCLWYEHSTCFHMFPHTPCVVLTMHYLSLFWTRKILLILDTISLACFVSLLPLPCTTFALVAGMYTIFTILNFYTPSLIFCRHNSCGFLNPRQPADFMAFCYQFDILAGLNNSICICFYVILLFFTVTTI